MSDPKTVFGMTYEEFCEFYKANNAFNDDINRNHPDHSDDEPFISFLEKGCDALIAEHPDLVRGLI